ncbi:mechanosensitive ion channel family protein [Cryptosporangium arvum]|uniref:Small-conductance mechanosensitive channel n=1 Tax=Cryptosporangium arvum DSM 44712 TaxID=927661 RepID=A0A010YIR0_9ACTN|nr:mechanosensitive ion channel domain-containing protein [Cryptosporangium arvum]EXG80135.1 small-conductance mechanosensitive channel [Cryptosporangium arvum DSM 44712]
MFDELPDAVVTLVTAAVSVLVALVVVQIIHVVVRRLGRRAPLFAQVAARLHRPVQCLAAVLAVQGSLHATTARGDWRGPLLHAITVLVIASVAWVVGALLVILEDAALSRFRTDVENNKRNRRVHTQIMVVRRVTVAVVVVVAVGAVLVTFPTARAAGASLLASAGIAGVVAGLAAQSVLGNVFAGVQLAFSDELRIDDVVVVEGEWGRVEDITLSYVVLHLWDDRRLTLPTSYFTTKPFQNWTRNESALLGAVEIDVDWAVPTEEMRRELRHVCEGTDLWDGRACVFQVTDAIGGMVRVRALVTARDAPTLFDLRCHVRERLVQWLRENYPEALPRSRADVTGIPGVRIDKVENLNGRDLGPAAVADAPDDARVFSGSADGRERNAAFAGRSEDT